MISSPAVVTLSLFLLFLYSQMPLLSTLSESLQNKDLFPIRAFPLHFRKMCVLKDLLQMTQMSLQGIQHLSSGSDLGYLWHSEANGRERTCHHSPCFCHLCWTKFLSNDRIMAFFSYVTLWCEVFIWEHLLYRRECLSLVLFGS